METTDISVDACIDRKLWDTSVDEVYEAVAIRSRNCELDQVTYSSISHCVITDDVNENRFGNEIMDIAV